MLESINDYAHNSAKLQGSWNQEGAVSMFSESVTKYPQSADFLSTLISELQELLGEKRVKRIAVLLVFNLMSCFFLLAWCSSTKSIALQAYMYTAVFSLLSLLICILSAWVERQKPSPLFSFGYERFEVLAVFASTVLAQLGTLFITKESIERLFLEQPEIHTGRLMLGAGVAFVSHIVVIYGCNNVALNHVMSAASSSWLQEHVSDISQSICSVMPALNGLLLPRVNPMLLIACAGLVSLFITNLLIEINNYHMCDTLAAVCISAMMCATMLPMSIYSGKVLLQTIPSHMVGQLDKCLSETLTIDGVLEFRNEHFWTLSFGKMAGSLHVRVHRDANEQLVLSRVVDRLSSLVSVLTVQVFKDEWAVRRSVPLPTSVSTVSLTFPSTTAQISVRTSSPFTTFNTATHATLSSVNVTTPVSNIFSHTVSEKPPQKVHVKLSDFHAPQNGKVQQPNVIYNPNIGLPNHFYKISPSVEGYQHSIHNSNYYFPSVQNSNSSLKQPLPNTLVQLQNPLSVSFSNVSPQHPANMQINNLLISGTRTLDAERFTYHPR